jgi:hypothetical protein
MGWCQLGEPSGDSRQAVNLAGAAGRWRWCACSSSLAVVIVLLKSSNGLLNVVEYPKKSKDRALGLYEGGPRAYRGEGQRRCPGPR